MAGYKPNFYFKSINALKDSFQMHTGGDYSSRGRLITADLPVETYYVYIFQHYEASTLYVIGKDQQLTLAWGKYIQCPYDYAKCLLLCLFFSE